MDQLIELLKQIQELAGVGVKALSEAGGAGGAEGKGGPHEGAPHGGEPAPAEDGEKPPVGPPR